MIKTFKHKGLELFFLTGNKKGISATQAPRLARMLDRLNAAEEIGDMNAPGYDLHLLEPKREGVFAVKVSGNRRITFKFREGAAYEVDYLDYH